MFDLRYNKSRLILFIWLSLMFFGTARATFSQLPETETPKTASLGVAAIALLEQVEIGLTDAKSDIRTGIIEFSITLSQSPIEAPSPVADVTGLAVHEETGYWQIRYLFEGERHFYDVKKRNKMELNGVSIGSWQESHLQYEMDMDAKTLLFQEHTDTGWRRHPLQSIPSGDFRLYYSPRWWIWPHWNATLTEVLHPDKVVAVKQLHTTEDSNVYIQLDETVSGVNLTSEIWLDTEKAYRPIRVLVHHRTHMKTPPQVEVLPGLTIPSQTLIQYRGTRWKYELQQFEQGLWYPRRVIREESATIEINDETRQPETPPIFRRAILEVHRAVFNVPIDEKDLRVTLVQ